MHKVLGVMTPQLNGTQLLPAATKTALQNQARSDYLTGRPKSITQLIAPSRRNLAPPRSLQDCTSEPSPERLPYSTQLNHPSQMTKS